MEKNKKINYLNLTNILFVIYCILLIWIILFKISCSIEDIISLSRDRVMNLIPFYYSEKVKFHFWEVIENVLIFMPFGIYLKMMNKENKKIVLYGFLVSFGLEISQFIFKIGATDITDLITNTSGAFLGICLYKLFEKMLKNKEKVNDIFIKLALITTILFCLMMGVLLILN